MINGDQIRSARALLGWSAKVLANHARVGVSTVLRLERSHDVLRGRCENVDRIEKALQAGGVSFLNDENGVGVRFSGQRTALPPARAEQNTNAIATAHGEKIAELPQRTISKASVR
jgi:transcriptional regulator with XRE-family HTH domain